MIEWDHTRKVSHSSISMMLRELARMVPIPIPTPIPTITPTKVTMVASSSNRLLWAMVHRMHQHEHPIPNPIPATTTIVPTMGSRSSIVVNEAVEAVAVTVVVTEVAEVDEVDAAGEMAITNIAATMIRRIVTG